MRRGRKPKEDEMNDLSTVMPMKAGSNPPLSASPKSGRSRGPRNKGSKGNSNKSLERAPQRFGDSIRLSTGVPDNVIINPSQVNTTSWTPLVCMNGALLGASSDATSVTPYDKTIREVIYWDYYNSIVEQSNGNDYIAPDQFDFASFVKWINAITDGLQLYYNVEHIMAFNSTPENENIGLVWMQNNFNAGVRRRHRDLRDALTRLSIPYNIELFIKYMYQNYSMSSDPQAPIFRLNWRGVFHPYANRTSAETPASVDNELGTDLYDMVINNINDASVRKIDSMIGVTRRYQENKSRLLSAVSTKSNIDLDFYTFWHNAPAVASNNGFPLTNAVTDSTLYYGKGNKDLDGIIYSLCGIFVGATYAEAKLYPKLYQPWNQFSLAADTDKRLVTNFVRYDDSITTTTTKAPKMLCITDARYGSFADNYWTCVSQSGGTSTAPVFSNLAFSNNAVQRAQLHSVDNTRASADAAVRWLFK